MARRRHSKQYHKYECTITGESFTRTAKAPNPDDLVSVLAWYEMNPDKDDRPEHIRLNQKLKDPNAEEDLDPFEKLARELGVEPKDA